MIALDLSDGIAALRFTRGGARNAMSTEGWEGLAETAATLATQDVRAVILCSPEPAIFSSGADIGEFAELQTDPARRTRFRKAMRAGIEALAALPMPVIAAIDGGCYGAAVALILACDLRVAGEGAEFAATPAKLGLGYPREDVARLAAQVGRGHAARMLYSGEILDAAEAHRIGLVELKWEEAEPLARTFADRIAANAPGAIRLLKATLDDPEDAALDAAFEARFGTDEFAEGLAAFRARRRPRFA